MQQNGLQKTPLPLNASFLHLALIIFDSESDSNVIV